MKNLASVNLAALTVLLAGAALALLHQAGGLWNTPLFADDEPAAKTDEAEEAQSEADTESTSNSDDASTETSKDAAEILEQARTRIGGYRSIKAELTESVHIGSRKFQSRGKYLQGDSLKLRLQFQTRVGGTNASLLQVSDGQVLWTRYQVGERTRITRRDVKQILGAARAQGLGARELMTVELGLGGLPALLAALADSMVFDDVRTKQIGDQSFTVLEGGWNEEYQQAFRMGDAEEELPQHVPDRVELYLDERLFPRRVRYLKELAGGNVRQSLVTLDVTRATLDADVDQSAFEFQPPDGVYQEDVTNTYLQRLQAAGGKQ